MLGNLQPGFRADPHTLAAAVKECAAAEEEAFAVSGPGMAPRDLVVVASAVLIACQSQGTWLDEELSLPQVVRLRVDFQRPL